MDKIKNLLQQVSIIQRKYDEIAKITGENFNIFSIMRAESDEVRTHSRIIAEFLNPKGMHNQGSVFIKLFFDEIQSLQDIKDNFDYENVTVLVEEHVGTIDKDYSEGGFIDIVIKDSEHQVVIENKIYAGDQKGQLLRYKNNYPDCKLIYLTLNGKEPSEFSYKIGNEKDLKLEEIILISYLYNIKNWIEKCLEKTHSLPIIRETLVQYLHLIKKLTNQTTNNNMKAEIKELIKGNYDEIDNLVKHYYEYKNDFIVKLDNIHSSVNRETIKDTTENLKWQFGGPNRITWEGEQLLKYEVKFENSSLFFQIEINFAERQYSSYIWINGFNKIVLENILEEKGVSKKTYSYDMPTEEIAGEVTENIIAIILSLNEALAQKNINNTPQNTY